MIPHTIATTARVVVVSLAVLLPAAPTATALQPAATPDPSFMTDGQVMALARAGDTIYIGGAFSEVGPATGPGVSISRATAQRNVALPGVSGGAAPQVDAVIADGAGGWWIGGNFTAVGGVARPYLAHVLADGTVGPALPAPDGPVRALALSPDGATLYLGGDFFELDGQSRARIGAISTATGALLGWAPAIGNGSVVALAADATNVYAGGTFTAIGGPSGNRLLAFSASTGNIAWNGDANGNVLALALDGSRLYVGGAFTTLLGATPAERLAALNVGGTMAWNGKVTHVGSEVDALAVSGSTLFAGGTFTAAGGTVGNTLSAARDRVAKLDATNGNVEAAWNPGTDAQVASMTLAGSTLYLGGVFTTVGGQTRTRLAAVDAASGAVDPWSPAAPNAPVRALAADAGSVYAGGTFESVGTVIRNNVAAIDATTGEATAWAPDVDSEVYALVATASTVYIGGAFSNVNSAPHAFIAAVQASDGQTVTGWDTNAQSYVNAIALSGSRLFIAGYFSNIDGTPAQKVAALNAADGTLVPGWAGAVTSGTRVDSLAVSPDGATLYLGGNFFDLNSVSRFYAGALATADGALLGWNPVADEEVFAIVPEEGVVYLGGGFVSLAAQPRRYAAAVDPTTGAPTSWNPDANNTVRAIARVGSTIYLGGDFATVGGIPRRGLAAVDASSAAVTSWNPDPSDNVLALHAGADGMLVAGGWFKSMTAGPRARLALFSSPPENTGAPLVTGTASPGEAMDCSLGSWIGSAPLAYTRRWLLDGNPIAGATGASYTVAEGDSGHDLTCRVTASNRAGAVSADSGAIAVPARVQAAAGPGPGPGARTAAELPPPVFARTANVYPLEGRVLVRPPGGSRFLPLTAPEQVRFGAIIDVTRGRVRICTAGPREAVQCAEFYGGRFKLVQRGTRARPITELVLVGGSFSGCPAARGAGAARKRLSPKSTVRKLWGSGKGNFRTRGRYAAATLRGTIWLTADRCDGTFVRVRTGSVTVRDLVKRKNILLRARRGSRSSYLARPRARGR